MSIKRGAPCLAGHRASVFCGCCEFLNNGRLSGIRDIQGMRGGDAEMCVFGSLLTGAHGPEGQLG